MFECLEISKTIYEGVVEPSYLKNTLSDNSHTGNIRNMKKSSRPVKEILQDEWPFWKQQEKLFISPEIHIETNLSD